MWIWIYTKLGNGNKWEMKVHNIKGWLGTHETLLGVKEILIWTRKIFCLPKCEGLPD